MAFNPKSEYTIVPKDISIRDFHAYPEDFVTRPPYQRKVVWGKKKKQALMDSLFRRYYIPKLVIREVRLSDDRTLNEVIDGQQRITTVQSFFNNEYPLPKSLADFNEDLVGKTYDDLSSDVKKFIDKSLSYQTDIIKDIDKPDNVEHQITATEIFHRLQQGETLNYMEVAHAQLSSLTRNFIVKYSDDETFDFEGYKPLDNNPHKHPFFQLLKVDNDRMKHLQFMARFCLIEEAGGYTTLSDKKIAEFVEEAKTNDGIGNYSYENTPYARAVLANLNFFHEIFYDKDLNDQVLPELRIEYFIISIYMLIRHLRMHYINNEETRNKIHNFVLDFHERWRTYDEAEDRDMLTFSNRRQQGDNDLEVRDRIVRQLFFEYLADEEFELLTKDEQRAFSELQRIKIYRDGKGKCAECMREGKPEKECKVSWTQFQADHILPHSKGGRTTLDNSELLCAYHNQSKGNRV